MSRAKKKKTANRQLVRLLRVLLRQEACLVVDGVKPGGVSNYMVFALVEGSEQVVLQPDRALVKYCLGEDLLEKATRGWVIGANGRLALKRMLAGAEPFAAQHQERAIRRHKTDGDRAGVLVNDRSSPLGWLSRRLDASGAPMISKTQFAAGERLAQDFQFAGLMPRITSSWSGPGTGGQRRSAPGAGIEMSDNRLAARQRVRNAISEVGGDLADILLDICCFQIGLSDLEKARNWPRRSGKVILNIALDQLADHYGMSPKTRRADTNSRISHWGEEGYKPL